MPRTAVAQGTAPRVTILLCSNPTCRQTFGAPAFSLLKFNIVLTNLGSLLIKFDEQKLGLNTCF